EVLAELVGRRFDSTAVLSLPALEDEVARARPAIDSLRARPEYEQFARSRDVLELRREVTASGERPRVSAIARAGYGRPGLNPLAREFDGYWLAGVQVEWSPWSWGATRREREELALQQQIVESEEDAFTETIRRGAVTELATADQLSRTLATDDEIIALREVVLREARLRFDEGVITAAELVDRETELLAARLARATHRVALARARARLLTLLGLEIS
ncbi:MAG TPA: TolC family protein, partial [Gemmatimonadaceae bacterium]|nr:TolC family protein [Gemmatimonadaceae bacterium]